MTLTVTTLLTVEVAPAGVIVTVFAARMQEQTSAAIALTRFVVADEVELVVVLLDEAVVFDVTRVLAVDFAVLVTAVLAVAGVVFVLVVVLAVFFVAAVVALLTDWGSRFTSFTIASWFSRYG